VLLLDWSGFIQVLKVILEAVAKNLLFELVEIHWQGRICKVDGLGITEAANFPFKSIKVDWGVMIGIIRGRIMKV